MAISQFLDVLNVLEFINSQIQHMKDAEHTCIDRTILEVVHRELVISPLQVAISHTWSTQPSLTGCAGIHAHNSSVFVNFTFIHWCSTYHAPSEPASGAQTQAGKTASVL